jgi:hypothetical protein
LYVGSIAGRTAAVSAADARDSRWVRRQHLRFQIRVEENRSRHSKRAWPRTPGREEFAVPRLWRTSITRTAAIPAADRWRPRRATREKHSSRGVRRARETPRPAAREGALHSRGPALRAGLRGVQNAARGGRYKLAPEATAFAAAFDAHLVPAQSARSRLSRALSRAAPQSKLLYHVNQ